MSNITTLNKRLLEILGLSAESAQIVMDHIAELTNEAGSLRTQTICLRQDLDEIRTMAKRAITRNGGPIDAETTTDGQAYVMVRRDDFDALAAEVANTDYPNPAPDNKPPRSPRS